MAQELSAFANGEGGTLIFGISDDDHISGLADAKGDAERISEEIKSKPDPVPAVNLELKDAGGKTLVLLHVYPGQETPYYYIGDKQRIAFVRIGNESVTADRTQLKALVLTNISPIVTITLVGGVWPSNTMEKYWGEDPHAVVINDYVALSHGPFWFADSNLCINKAMYADNLTTIKREVQRSKEDFIQEHFRKYSSPDVPPVWNGHHAQSFLASSRHFLTSFLESP